MEESPLVLTQADSNLFTPEAQEQHVLGGLRNPPAEKNPQPPHFLDSTHLTQKAFAFTASLSDVLTHGSVG